MEFVLLVFGLVTFNIAWRARGETRYLRKLIDELRAEVIALRGNHLPVQQPATAPPEAVVAPPAPRQSQPSAVPVPVPASVPATAPASATAPTSPPPASPPATEPVPILAPVAAQVAVPLPIPVPASAARPVPAPATAARSTIAPTASPPVFVPPAARAPQPAPQWLVTAKAWLFGGNLVAKLGLLILFIGVSFLLKYTAARVTLPIELRLAAIVLADLAVLTWGWRIRIKRPAISLPVQGAALAVLMLVTFGAFRVYHLIPAAMAFALLLVLTVFTCLLAVLQNAMWLAIFGIAGGFATPILASSGGGSHIGLFSYYALLNGGVLALALSRSWRPLNLLGFAFTFSIATAWGVLRYTPENYVSVQLFLLLFFAFYVSIPLAYARQQSVRLKHYVDGTLVFGTPMLAFGLQFSLVSGFDFGVAYSALALGLFYVALATALRCQQHAQRYALLADSFLALGIVFGTLAIPFALDGRWTSAAWALEGAGIVWIGLRQQQKLAWMFGLLVQAGAWISFLGSAMGLSPVDALDANLWLGFLLLAVSAFLMATRFRAHMAAEDNDSFALLAGVFLVFATGWLVAGAWTEILLRVVENRQGTLLVGSAMIAVIGLYLVARKMAWPLAGGIALAVQAVAGFKLLQLAVSGWYGSGAAPSLLERPLLGALMIVGAALFSSWALWRRREASTSTTDLTTIYRLTLTWSALWWFCLAAPNLASWLAGHYAGLFPQRYPTDEGLDASLQLCAYSLLLACTALAAVRFAHRLRWPSLRWFAAPVWLALTGATLLMLVDLYDNASRLPRVETWIAFAALWLAGEWLLVAWPRQGWAMRPLALRVLHIVRTAGPWLMIWPVVAHLIGRWLAGAGGEALIADWGTSASWARFVPSWLMMAAIAWLMQRSRQDAWPVAPIAPWYRSRLIPAGCAWSALLVAAWNLTQDGAMAPLPYLPLLNPLDLSTCFALLLLLACHRLQAPPTRGPAGWPAGWMAPLPLVVALLGYAWFNLALLRTVSHYLAVPYEFASMFASQFVQAMLSLVWSVTALLLMRYAARRAMRPVWIIGAALLGMVVAKLFLVDLSNIGGVERIVSFLGVGALMVGIGYLAPFPQSEPAEPQAQTA
ncbi:UNVERIFIED_ORG: putative membrane protein DUF2339 [Zoogloea ramigera]|uniref:DUF2339 domain-containing protein n=1 Tax=Duganella zoogloeoides TaxID=75659 RepID=A0ABZ0XWW5_9BURK|nr:DUF2339 domain-containing protein [Duganella zoogloeoides]WQH04073.1 DUF2339 domain-containing protein [Duganella zoogloeoides]